MMCHKFVQGLFYKDEIQFLDGNSLAFLVILWLSCLKSNFDGDIDDIAVIGLTAKKLLLLMSTR